MIFGDKSKFAIEVEFLEDPNNEKWSCWDEKGTYGHFDIFINGVSIFKHKQYDMIEDYSIPSGYRILTSYTEYDSGTTNHLAPVFEWLRYVYDGINLDSKSRFTRFAINDSPYGTSGNIYPDFYIKRSGNKCIVNVICRRLEKNLCIGGEYLVEEKIKLPWGEVSDILSNVLNEYYTTPSVNTQEWFKKAFGT